MTHKERAEEIINELQNITNDQLTDEQAVNCAKIVLDYAIGTLEVGMHFDESTAWGKILCLRESRNYLIEKIKYGKDSKTSIERNTTRLASNKY